MAAEIPSTFKIITSAIRRAEELERDPNPDAKIVSYYCRLYAVTKASKLCSVPAVAAETKFLIDEMGKLERFKATSEALTPEKGANTCKTYAFGVFQKADDEDRAGAADKGTAKLYYAAGTFFDVMEQFGEMSGEVVEKRKYAKWKATEILNAIKNGERPTPGGYGEGMAGMSLSDEADSGMNIPPAPKPVMGIPAVNVTHAAASPTSSAGSPVPPPFKAYVPQPSAPPMAPIIPSAANMGQYYAHAPPPTFTRPPVANNDPRVQDTVELCNFAILALKKNEVALAKDRLREALRRLE